MNGSANKNRHVVKEWTVDGEDAKLRNIVSWQSALQGLVILAEQNKILWDKWKEPCEKICDMKVTIEEKEKIKTSVKFLKYISKKI